jgi:hypothetical protein
MENQMKQLIALIATAFTLSAFAAEPAKAPVATPAVTKADAPVPTALKEAAKKPATKSPAKKDDKKAVTTTAPAPAASK